MWLIVAVGLLIAGFAFGCACGLSAQRRNNPIREGQRPPVDTQETGFLTTDGVSAAVDIAPKGCVCAAFTSLCVGSWTCPVHGTTNYGGAATYEEGCTLIDANSR